jgi:hypothetical protein
VKSKGLPKTLQERWDVNVRDTEKAINVEHATLSDLMKMSDLGNNFGDDAHLAVNPYEGYAPDCQPLVTDPVSVYTDLPGRKDPRTSKKPTRNVPSLSASSTLLDYERDNPSPDGN